MQHCIVANAPTSTFLLQAAPFLRSVTLDSYLQHECSTPGCQEKVVLLDGEWTTGLIQYVPSLQKDF
jgi:hypothetical protein